MKYIALALLLAGCCPDAVTKTETIIHIDTVQVQIPADVQFDTIRIDNGSGESEKFIVRVDTLYKNVFVKGKERIVYVPQIDTVIRTETTVQPDFWDMALSEIVFSGLIALCLILAVVIIARWGK